VAFSKLTLKEITNKICDGVEARAEQGLYTYRIICYTEIFVVTCNNLVYGILILRETPWSASYS
jgi:hypothetical protein